MTRPLSKKSDLDLQQLRAAIARVEGRSGADDAPVAHPGKQSLKADDEQPDARGLALRLLTRREHGAGELQRKLEQRGVERNEAREAIAEMAEQGWQSDERFAEQFAADHAARGDGPLKIRAALQARGVKEGAIVQALEALEVNWLAQARQVRRKRFGDDLPSAADAQAKQIRFLMTRGFSASVARTAVRSHDSQDD